ncbi:ABC transporter substrate-binding protein [Cohnella abietis]|uniref:Ferrichrome ABC transporter substrate-binding protein n=1 Tax=Cohnella abietis TaxID=2507935 RepID=A0A3T1D1W6_9BACL|nr:ABC transporter substrate-binding protein [Cohnella abietis]BBI32086.1 ferrichrome ABC transporter substrate-binding protein [Cohnella abietis]
MERLEGSRNIILKGLITLLIVITALAGCSKAQDEKPAAEPTNQGDVSNTETNTENKESEQPSTVETRIVTDQFGDVEIPVKPKRIAAIYLEDYLVALGVEPVVQWYHPTWGKQDYLNLSVPQFDITGDIEALLASEPDLIISDGYADAAKYEKYSKVAPTYRLTDDIQNGSTTEILSKIADIIGMPEKAEELLKDYDQKIADMKTKLQAKIGNETVAVLRLNVGERDINLLGIKNRFVGSILYKELGLTPPKLVADMDKFIDTISMEKLPELGADHIIILTSNGAWSSPENEEAVSGLMDSPIWKSIPAVKNGHVYQVDRTYWQTGAFSANLLKLKDLEKYLLK